MISYTVFVCRTHCLYFINQSISNADVDTAMYHENRNRTRHGVPYVVGRVGACSDNVPDILSSMTELAAGNTGTQAETADTDGVILEGIGKVVASLGHGTNEDTNTLLRTQVLDIIPNADHRSVETEGDLATVWWQMIGDWVLDDLEKFLLRRGRADRQSVQ